jgi:hypothetical protein
VAGMGTLVGIDNHRAAMAMDEHFEAVAGGVGESEDL